MTWVKRISFAAAAAALLSLVPDAARAQSAETMLPAESEARARRLLDESIAALGGQAYLGVRDIYRKGRLAQFGNNGELNGYVKFEDYVKLPDKNRTEYADKKNLMDIFNGNQGWSLDRGGVTEMPADALERFQESLKKDVDILLRSRLHEEGLRLRYAGPDVVDLKAVEWVEVTDRERRITRIAVETATRLPLQAVYQHRHPETRQRTEEVELFSNYHDIQGVQTPLQTARERNGRRIYQAFFETYQYNASLPDFLFSRESLDQRWAQLDKKKKK